MLSVTKIFRFEMAHALHGYAGKCSNIHGHSYVLQVSVRSAQRPEHYLPGPGFIMDFKELKAIVTDNILDNMDHKLLLSQTYIDAHCNGFAPPNLVVFDAEPSAENLLLYIKNKLNHCLPAGVQLCALKLYETQDSYAEWTHAEAVRAFSPYV